VPTSRQFCAQLRGSGHDAYLETLGNPSTLELLPRGELLDGRGWIVFDAASDGFPGEDQEMPGRLEVQVYESASENAPHWRDGIGVPFNDLVAVLGDCTPAQAAEALQRADRGDYSAFGADVPPMTAARPLQGALTADGSPVFDLPAREYLGRLANWPRPEEIAPWRTGACPECGRAVAEEGLSFDDDGAAAHVTIRGAVVLGCEGYFVVDPAEVNLDRGLWQDWRETPAALPAPGARSARARTPPRRRPGRGAHH